MDPITTDAAVSSPRSTSDRTFGEARVVPLPERDIAFGIVPARVLRILLLVIVTLVVLSTASRMVVLFGPDFPARDSLANFLYVDFERSLPTLFSTGMLLTSAFLCAVIAHAHRRVAASEVRHWIALAVIFCLLALDEFGQLHEKSMDPLRRLFDIEGGPLWFAWVLPAIVLLAASVLFFIRFLGRLPRATRRGMLFAGLVFVAGALGVEMIGASYAADHPAVDATYVVMVTVEETLEMLGMAILIWTLLAFIPLGLPDTRWTTRVAPEPPHDAEPPPRSGPTPGPSAARSRGASSGR